MVRCCRLEKRRQAMLEMPQMIQTWKEVSIFPSLEQHTVADYLCREVTAVDGRSGRNRRIISEEQRFVQNSPSMYYVWEPALQAYAGRIAVHAKPDLHYKSFLRYEVSFGLLHT